MPPGVGRDLWFDVRPVNPDHWHRQRSDRWLRAERIQGAYRKGWNDADEEQRRRDADKAASTARAAEDRKREQALRDKFS